MYKLAFFGLSYVLSFVSALKPPVDASGLYLKNGNAYAKGHDKRAVPLLTSICTTSSNNFAIISTNPGNVPVGDAASLCTSVGLSLADITSATFQEALAVQYACLGTNAGAWVRSWDTNTYGLSGLEMRTGSVVSTSGVIVAPYSANNPVICSGAAIPSCSSGRIPLQIDWSGGSVEADGFFGSVGASVLDSNNLPISGYKQNTITSPFVSFNSFGNPADYRRGGAVWDARYVYATAAWREGLTATFEGWNGATLLYTKSVVLNSDKPYLVLLDFTGIDRLVLKGAGGTNVNYQTIGEGTQVSIENFNICV